MEYLTSFAALDTCRQVASEHSQYFEVARLTFDTALEIGYRNILFKKKKRRSIIDAGYQTKMDTRMDTQIQTCTKILFTELMFQYLHEETFTLKH